MEKLKACIEVFDENKDKTIDSIKTTNIELQKAYEHAAKSHNHEEPLDGVHTPAWKLLYEAAKVYSEKSAYPEEKFPYLAAEAKCVLCMSNLDEESRARIARFHSYMTDKTKELADDAERKLNLALQLVKNTQTPDTEAFEPLCNELTECIKNDGGISEAFREIANRKKLLQTENLKEIVNTYPRNKILAEDISKNLNALLQEKLKELTDSIDIEKYEKNKAHKELLELKKSIHLAKPNITQYISDCKNDSKANNAINSLKSSKTKFSNKAKNIVTQTVTPEFTAIFKEELELLGTDIKIEISAVVRDIDTSHAFSIGSKKPGKVLSEGELKVISIAAFLTEVRTYKNTQPIIFDDPVSSLDHIYREKIASRLAQEAKNRQVIIFTHDISLIAEIENKTTEMALRGSPTPSAVFTIKRNGTDSGFVSEKAPWRGMGTGQRAQKLEEDIRSITQLFATDVGSYNEKCAHVYCLLREAWESLIEQDLLCQVVVRGRNSIQTLRLNELIIDPNDANTIEINMSKSSNWMTGHDKSKALDENRPAPDEVIKDINELRVFSN